MTNVFRFVASEVFTEVPMKNTIFSDVTPCSPTEVHRIFEEIYGPHFTFLGFSSALKTEAVHTSKMSVDIYQATWRHIPEISAHQSGIVWCFVRL
jgi:hypothetical protein